MNDYRARFKTLKTNFLVAKANNKLIDFRTLVIVLLDFNKREFNTFSECCLLTIYPNLSYFKYKFLEENCKYEKHTV